MLLLGSESYLVLGYFYFYYLKDLVINNSGWVYIFLFGCCVGREIIMEIKLKRELCLMGKWPKGGKKGRAND